MSLTQRRFATTLGAALILLGVVTPSAAIVGFLRETPEALRQQLLSGAALFRLGLVLLGGFAIATRKWLPQGTRRNGSGQAALFPSPVRTTWGLLALLLAVSFALRLHQLGSGLWLDEVIAFVENVRLPLGEIVSTYASENQHFLYTIMAHLCFSIFGESEWALRLPAVLFGVGNIWATYLLGKLLTNSREALFAAALLALSYYHVWFSQNARGYTGLLFWTLFSSWLLLLGMRQNRPTVWISYAAVASLGVYTHITMIFVIVGQFVTALLSATSNKSHRDSSRISGFLFGFVLAGLLCFQLFALVLPQVVTEMSNHVSVVEEWKSPIWTLLELTRGLQVNFAGGMAALGTLLLFGAGLRAFWRSEPALVQLLFIPPLVGSAAVLTVGHHLWPRFFFFVFGFATVVLIRGASTIGELIERWTYSRIRRRLPIVNVMCGSMLLASALSVPSAFGPKQDYEGAMAYVEATRASGDSVVTVGLASVPYQTLYKPGWSEVNTAEELASVRRQSKRTLLVYTLEPVLEIRHPDLMASIRRDFTVLKDFPGTLRGGAIFVCVARRASAAHRPLGMKIGRVQASWASRSRCGVSLPRLPYAPVSP